VTKSPIRKLEGGVDWSLNAHRHPPPPFQVRSASMILVLPFSWKVRRMGWVLGPCQGPISAIVTWVSSAATTAPECFSVAEAHPEGTNRSKPNANATLDSAIAHLLFN
jgi:hypothetical protein